MFEELRSASPRVRPDLRSYNLAIKGCESPPTKTLRPQQLATAMSLLEELRAQGLAPDEYTYGTLIDLCARVRGLCGGSLTAALLWLDGLGGAGAPLSRWCHTPAMAGQAGHRWACTNQILRGLSSLQVSSLSMVFLLVVPLPPLQAKNGPQALALYEEMQQRGIKPNKTLVTSLFKALGASGMVDDCMRIFRKIVWGPARRVGAAGMQGGCWWRGSSSAAPGAALNRSDANAWQEEFFGIGVVQVWGGCCSCQ